MKLEPFQRRLLEGHFKGAQEVVCLLPKKNYKTTMMAALGLYHIRETEDAECVIGASSRDQASVLFRQAEGLVRRSELPGFEVRTGYREIRYGGGRMRVLAADAATADGVIPTLALVDELHRHPSGDLYGVFRDGLEARDGRMITISTAGYNSASPLGLLRAKAYAMPSFKREGVYNYAVSGDGAFEFHEWCLADSDDLSDMRLVKRVNPAKHHTLGSLRRRYESPSMTPARWARFACGIFPEHESPWIPPATWDALRWDVGGIAEGEPVTIGVRIGVEAGIAIVALRDDERIAVKLQMVSAPPSGRVSLAEVEAELRRLAEVYRVLEIVYDRDQFERSADLLIEAGLPMQEVPQSPKRLATATATLWRVASGGLLGHDGDPVLRAQVLAGQPKETTQGLHLVPTRQTSGLIALAVAVHEATEVEPEPPMFIAL